MIHVFLRNYPLPRPSCCPVWCVFLSFNQSILFFRMILFIYEQNLTFLESCYIIYIMTSLEAYQLEHTDQNTRILKGMIYFHKYNFDISQVDYKEIKEREEMGSQNNKYWGVYRCKQFNE